MDGVCCEFGVAGGHASALLANEIVNFSNKKLYLFDSFEGLPEPTKEDELIDDVNNLGNILSYAGKMNNPKRRVKRKLSALKISKTRYKIFKGFVDKSYLEKLNLNENICFTYIDFDFYEPIKVVLEFLVKRTKKGSFIIVDDYDFFSTGAKLAVDNFLEEYSNLFEKYIAPKLIGNFIIIKRVN